MSVLHHDMRRVYYATKLPMVAAAATLYIALPGMVHKHTINMPPILGIRTANDARITFVAAWQGLPRAELNRVVSSIFNLRVDLDLPAERDLTPVRHTGQLPDRSNIRECHGDSCKWHAGRLSVCASAAEYSNGGAAFSNRNVQIGPNAMSCSGHVMH